MSDPTALVTKAQLFRIAAERNLPLDDDRLHRWRTNDLTPESLPIQGSTERGFTWDRAQRILLVAEAAERVPSSRPKSTEIAFALAYDGHEAPPLLVLEHVQNCTELWQRRVFRMLDGHGEGKLYRINAPARLAPQLIRAVIRFVSPSLARNTLLLEGSVAAAEIAIRLLWNGRAGEKSFGMFERLFARLFPAATPEAPRMLWDLLHEAMAFLRLDERNAILLAVRDSPRDPELVMQAASDTRLLLHTGAIVFPWMTDAETLAHLGWFTVDDRQFLDRYFAPMVCGLLLGLRKDDFAQRRLADIRCGNTQSAIDDLENLKHIGSDIASRFRSASG